MPKGILFWVIFVLAILFGGYGCWNTGNRWAAGMSLVVAILLFLLGWQVFGFVIQ